MSDGYFLTGSNASTSATVGLSLDDADSFGLSTGALVNQTLQGTGQLREVFSNSYLFTGVAPGAHTVYLLGSTGSATPFVSAAQSNLIVQVLAIPASS